MQLACVPQCSPAGRVTDPPRREGINSLSFALATSVIVKLVAGYGTITVAVYGTSIKVLHFGVMAIVELGLGTGAPLIARMFFSDPAVVQQAAVILRIMAFSLPFIGLHIGAETVFEGAGQNTPPMVLSIVHSWVMVIPLMYVAGSVLELGPNAVMVGWGVAHIFGGLAALWLFRRGTWVKHEV